MNPQEVPYIVIASSGEESIRWEQTRDSLADDFAEAIELSDVGEVRSHYPDSGTTITVVDPLRQQS